MVGGGVGLRCSGDAWHVAGSHRYASLLLSTYLSHSLHPLVTPPPAVGRACVLGVWDVGGAGPVGEHDLEEAGGWPLQVRCDPGGVVAVTAHADGRVCVTDSASGQALAVGRAHGDVAAGRVHGSSRPSFLPGVEHCPADARSH